MTGWKGSSGSAHPRPGDLIVWRGHVGIVVNPEEDYVLERLAFWSKSLILPVTLLAAAGQAALPALCWPR